MMRLWGKRNRRLAAAERAYWIAVGVRQALGDIVDPARPESGPSAHRLDSGNTCTHCGRHFRYLLVSDQSFEHAIRILDDDTDTP